MLYNRTYLDKCATIVKGSKLNTGFNPVSELVYGRNSSRTLVYFSHDRIKRMVDDKVFPDVSKLTHTLKMTNAGSLDFSELNKVYSSQIDGAMKKRASSFDLIFFLIPEDWDNGKGFDYTTDNISIDFYDKGSYEMDKYISEDGVNWFKPKNGRTWKKEPQFQKTTDELVAFYLKSDKTKIDNNGDLVIFTYSCCIGENGFANKGLKFKVIGSSLDFPLEVGTPVYFSRSGQVCTSDAAINEYAKYAQVTVRFPRNTSGRDKKYAFRCEYEIDGNLYHSNPYIVPGMPLEKTPDEPMQYMCYVGASSETSLTNRIVDGFGKFYSMDDELVAEASTKFGDFLWFVVPFELEVQDVVSKGMPVSLDDEVQVIQTEAGKYKAYRTLQRLDVAYWPLIINSGGMIVDENFSLNNPHPEEAEGIYSTELLSEHLALFEEGKPSIVIGKQHFDIGCENISVDITDTFNRFITGDLENHGIGIAFAPEFEEMELDIENYVGILTNRTNSFFEPYIETIYTESVLDDRQNFVLGKENRLYLYANIGDNLVNLDQLPTCSINGTEYEVKQGGKGMYYITVTLPQNAFSAPTILYDTWDGLLYQGKYLSPVELEFTTRPASSFFQLGYNIPEKGAFTPSVYGINDSEHIKRGDVRKVCFTFKKDYTRNTAVLVDDVEVRFYVMDGTAQVNVTPYLRAERAFNDTYVMVDTSILIPNTYYMDVRIKYGMEMIEHHDVLHFTIVNEENNRFA